MTDRRDTVAPSPQQPTQEAPVDDTEVMRTWRECGLSEYFLGNGGTNRKLVAFADRFAAQRVTAAREAKARDHQAAIDNLRECGVAFRMIHDALTELSDAVPPIRERDV